MNQAIIDTSLLAVSLITAIVVGMRIKGRVAGMILSTLLLFPPLLVFLNMWAHTVAVSVMNIRRIKTGSFQYNFTIYSHFLFGITFIVLSGFSIHYTSKYLSCQLKQKRNIFLLNLITSLLFLPVGFINPIGFLPVLTSIFSSLVLLFDRSYRKKVQRNIQNETKVVHRYQEHAINI